MALDRETSQLHDVAKPKLEIKTEITASHTEYKH